MQFVLTDNQEVAQVAHKEGNNVLPLTYDKEKGGNIYKTPFLEVQGINLVKEGKNYSYNIHVVFNLSAAVYQLKGQSFKWKNNDQVWGHCIRNVEGEDQIFSQVEKWYKNLKEQGALEKNGSVILTQEKGSLGHFVTPLVYIEVEDKPTGKNKNGNVFYQINCLDLKNPSFVFRGCGKAPRFLAEKSHSPLQKLEQKAESLS